LIFLSTFNIAFPLWQREAVKKLRGPGELHKSPLTPLLQRGELGFERAGILDYLRGTIVLSLFNISPFEKGGYQGDLKFFRSFRGIEGDLNMSSLAPIL
jgi:hypothetical protein